MRDMEIMEKEDKKAIKAAAKIAKKQAADHSPTAPAYTADGKPSPAERSAQAAERQVELQKRRVLLSLLGVLIAAAAVVATLYTGGFLTPSERNSPPVATRPIGHADSDTAP